MKEKIHDLKTALKVLRIEQTVSFDDCQKLMTDVHDKTGFTPPNFEISGNQWCALVNLAVARFGNTTPPAPTAQPKEDREPIGWRKRYNDEWAYSFTEDAWAFIRKGQPKEPEQEPVAFPDAPQTIYLQVGDECPEDAKWKELVDVCWCDEQVFDNDIVYVRADATPPQRTWEGLSVFEINDLVENTEYEDYRGLVEATEAKLRKKNQ